jgi:WD40 repeat protein
LKLIDDCERFVLQSFDIIEKAATHIYHSALPWSPTSSLTRNLYQEHITHEVKLLNAIDGNWDPCIRTIPIRPALAAIAFSPKGALVAVVSSYHVTIFEAVTGIATFQVHEPNANSVTFSPDDNMLACGHKDGSVKLWDVQTRNLVRTCERHTDSVRAVAFSSCGSMIASGSDDNTIKIWSTSTGHCKCVLEGHSDSVRAVCWSGTGDRVVSGSKDATVRIWDISRRRCLMILRQHTSWVTSVASVPDSFLVASGSSDKTVQVYDSRSGDVIQTISTNGPIRSVQFSLRGDKLMYTNRSLALAFIWDLGKNVCIPLANCDGDRAAFSLDGTRIAAGFYDEIKIWNTDGGYSKFEIDDHHPTHITDVSFAPDGQLMTSQSRYGVLKLWNVTTGECLSTVDSNNGFIHSAVFSPDSAFVVCLLDTGIFDEPRRQVQFLNVRRYDLVRTISVDEDATHIALSPNHDMLASLSSRTITLWNLGRGWFQNLTPSDGYTSYSSRARLFDLGIEICDIHFMLNIDYSEYQQTSRIGFSVDGTRIFIRGADNRYIRSWSIPDSFAHSSQATSIPLAFPSMQGESSHQNHDVSVPRQCCRCEEGDEWILDQGGKRILWVPPDRRSQSSDSHGKKVAVGTKSGRVYVADFSDALLSSIVLT